MKKENHNYFTHQSAARRYAESRPYFHPLVVQRISQRVALHDRVPLALDVACGTGQSTIALVHIAQRVVGTDISSGMLSEATKHPRVSYVRAKSEHLPFAPGVFDFVTVALAFHWFDREHFMAEASRVLKPGGSLVIYNNAFMGRMNENSAFELWAKDNYLSRYPTPPRNNVPLSDEEAARHGFGPIERERYTNGVTFTSEELARYLMTQSNVIAKVEEAVESPDDVYDWLIGSVRPLFPTERCTFQFGGTVEFLRR